MHIDGIHTISVIQQPRLYLVRTSELQIKVTCLILRMVRLLYGHHNLGRLLNANSWPTREMIGVTYRWIRSGEVIG